MIVLSGFITGCVSYHADFITPATSQQADCLQFYRLMDNAIFSHGVEDSGEHRVDGFPFLRSNRFLASLADDPLSDAAYFQWLKLLRRLDEQARILEIANLPGYAKSQISNTLPAGSTILRQLQFCGRLLTEAVATSDSTTKARLANAVAVPDNYQNWQRILGFYPLAKWFAENSIEDLHKELAAPFRLPAEDIPVSGQLVRYRSKRKTPLTTHQISNMLAAAYQNPLQIPLLESEQIDRLSAHFAPIWEIDTLNGNDAIGSLLFSDSDKPVIDTRRPIVYVQSAYTRFRDDYLLQLIYQIWFPARQKTGGLDLYGGDLDSLIWRVTLDRQGTPIAYDSIHACGCYYLLFPAEGYSVQKSAKSDEPVLSPKQIKTPPFQHRLSIRVAARTHYLQQISIRSTLEDGDIYLMADYNRLRSLPTKGNARKNPFGTDGIIETSARGERFFLWPFGVPSPGAMRQWGKHAIAFVGRRHFDDADLLEKLLVREKKR